MLLIFQYNHLINPIDYSPTPSPACLHFRSLTDSKQRNPASKMTEKWGTVHRPPALPQCTSVDWNRIRRWKLPAGRKKAQQLSWPIAMMETRSLKSNMHSLKCWLHPPCCFNMCYWEKVINLSYSYFLIWKLEILVILNSCGCYAKQNNQGFVA